MRERILEIIEKNSLLTPCAIAEEIGEPVEAVTKEIGSMEKENIICGYNTIINWDKAGRNSVTALIEVRVTPQRGNGFDKIAERMVHFKEVKSLFLMSGGFDFTIVVEGENIKEIAFFVSDKLSPIDSVLSTSTHFILKKYKEHGVIMGKSLRKDERMIVSP